MLGRLRVSATAADGCVTATLSHREGFAIEFAPRKARTHTDASLAAAVTSVLTGVLKAYRLAFERVNDAVDLLMDSDAGVLKAERATRRRTRAEHCRDVQTLAASPDGNVRVGYRGLDTAECRLRPGTMRGGAVDFTRLAAEITAARNRAEHEHRHRIRDKEEGTR